MMDKVAQDAMDHSIKESLSERDHGRKTKIQSLKEEKELYSPDQAKLFENTFNQYTRTILDSIKLIEEKKPDQKRLPEHFNSIKKDINSLSKYLSVSTKFLTNYTVKKSMTTVESFENKMKNLETELLPRRKFGFKAQQRNEAKKPINIKDKAVVPINVEDEVDSTKKLITYSITSCGFSDKKNESLKLCDDEHSKNDVELINLDNCTVFLCGNPSTVHISNITSCKILIGPVSTSVFLENCSDSDIVVACQQLRIHSTQDSRFYCHVTSRAIIEDSHGVQFAPYNLQYDELAMHFKSSGLSESLNNWNIVDDFNWLASDAHSPNWSVIKEEDRVQSWL